MRKGLTAAVAISMLGAAGCAGRAVWCRAGGDRAALRRDTVRCEEEAAQYARYMGKDGKAAVVSSRMADCMGLKGYTQAGCYPPAAETEDRSAIVVISDIHLGDARSLWERYGWMDKNRPLLADFLGFIRKRSDVRELVVAGDLFDEWVAPMDHDTFDGRGQSGFVDAIASTNSAVVSAFNDIIRDGAIKVVYVPGNHDMLVTAEDVDRVFPGIVQAREGARGLGVYEPSAMPNLRVEHGHRYDLFNAPETEAPSVLPPGFFVSKIAASAGAKSQPVYARSAARVGARDRDISHYLVYKTALTAIAFFEKVKDWDAKVIKTDAGGFQETYAVNDLIPRKPTVNGVPLDATLYRQVMNGWFDRQAVNGVPLPRILPELALGATSGSVMDLLVTEQFFSGSAPKGRVVVFGHTHTPQLIDFKDRSSVYANTGTWIDSGKPCCTFVTVAPKRGGSAAGTVALSRYLGDGKTEDIKTAALRD